MKRDIYGNHPVFYYEKTDSTNLRAKENADNSLNGTVFSAGEQTNGRGRMDRKWLSKPRAGAWFSYLYKPSFDLPAEKTPGLVFVAALSATDALIKLTSGNILVKWPNDIVCNGKKLCGIMCEMKTRDIFLDYAVIGIGINLLSMEFPEDLPHASSVEHETGVVISPDHMVRAFLDAFDVNLRLFEESGLSPILSRLAPISATLGKTVTAYSSAGQITGVATGFREDGALYIDTGNGTETFIAGDVSVRGVMGYT